MRFAIPVMTLAAVFAIGGLHAEKAGVSRTSIVDKSPFLPPDFNPPGKAGIDVEAPLSSSRFRFKGVYQLSGEFYFHVFDESARRGSWIGRNSAPAGFPRVVRFIESQNRLVLELQGEQLVLEMQQGAITGSGLADAGSRPLRIPYSTDSQPGEPITRRPVLRSLPSKQQSLAVRRPTF